MSVKESLTQMMTDTKIATGVATTTTGTGLATFLDIIPDGIGKLATLVGIVLSCVLIYTHLRKGRAEYDKIRLETRLLVEKEERRAREAQRRRETGQPTRRQEDQG